MASLKLDRLRSALDKFEAAYGQLEVRPGDAVEHTIWAMLARHGTKDRATRAYNALFKTFVDIDELRVAKVADIAEPIEEFVRGDPYPVAEKVRGFLRKLWDDKNTISFAFAKELDREALRKYLATLPYFGPELALGVFLKLRENETDLVPAPHASRVAVRIGAAPTGTTPARLNKMLEDELTDLDERLRVLFAYSAHGGEICFPKTPNCGECMLGDWCPAYNPPKKLSKAALETEARATKSKKTITKKKTARKTARKTTKKTSRGGGASQPRTTRSRQRSSSGKKSSRR